MDNQKALEVLKRGMNTEIWGLNFYQQALTRTADKTGKEVFKSLIAEEESHLKILRGEYGALSDRKSGWISREDALKLASSVEPADIFPAPEAVGKLIQAAATDLEVLEMAMEFEQKGYVLYQKEASTADDPEARKMWSYLAKAENKHYTFIQQTHEYLLTNGVWYFDEKEKPFFEG